MQMQQIARFQRDAIKPSTATKAKKAINTAIAGRSKASAFMALSLSYKGDITAATLKAPRGADTRKRRENRIRRDIDGYKMAATTVRYTEAIAIYRANFSAIAVRCLFSSLSCVAWSAVHS